MNTVYAVLFALLFASVAAKATFYDHDEFVADEYIVVFNSSLTESAFTRHFETINSHPAWVGNEVFKHYDFMAFHGYHAKLTATLLYFIMSLPEVAYVERNGFAHVVQNDCEIQEKATWGLSRIANLQLDGSLPFRYPESAGEGVTAYIIDTGILKDHPEFGGRASWGYTAYGADAQDRNGHGTHVAGTVGSAEWGVAKKCTLVAVKVLGDNGSGTLAGVIDGINWVAANQRKPAVANMSLGSSKSQAVNDASNNLVASGVTLSVAAGNSNANACNYSPASAEQAISVASSDSSDMRSYFSNYGTCTHVFAPGSAITSTWLGNSYNTISGTSMASPHVCGVTALYLADYPQSTPAQVKNWVVAQASSGYISNPGTGSPNKLLYIPCIV